MTKHALGERSGFVLVSQDRSLASGRVALHAARVGAGLEDAALRGLLTRAGGEPSARPFLTDMHTMPTRGEFPLGGLRHTPFDREMTRVSRARIERAWRVLGVEFRTVDRFLQVHPVMH